MDRREERLGFFEEFQELAGRKTYAHQGALDRAVELSNPVCGDSVRIALRVRQGRVAGYAYQARGCWPVSACLELMGDLLKDVRVECLLTYRLEQFLGKVDDVPAGKRHAFSLVYRATLQALALAQAEGDEMSVRRNLLGGAPLGKRGAAEGEA